MSQQPLPTPSTPLDLHNVQGDVLGGFPKKTETYFFFQVTKAATFRSQLAHLVPLIKTTAQVVDDRKAIDDHKKKHEGHDHKPTLLPIVGVNIAFSRFGLEKLGITVADITALGDTAFLSGQLKDAGANLNDKGTGTGDSFVPDWDPAFKEKIDGVILIAGDSHASVDKKFYEVRQILGVGTSNTSVHEVKTLRGDVRPAEESGHEHFGFQDGVSNPAIIGFDLNPNPGPKPVRAGILLAGRDGDSRAATRPSWSFDGSFLVFRYLFQLVPEFNQLLQKNPVVEPGLSPEEGSELRGARLVGRWKSGAPIDITPLKDDPALAADPTKNNDFRFQGEHSDASRCPFAAHIRKTNPRADLEDPPIGISIENRRIMRRGIAFGPEVTLLEKLENTTQHGRGLLFASYESSIVDGFQFLQQSWADNIKFPPVAPVVPGFDPIIGQEPNAGPRSLIGTNPVNLNESLTLDKQLVVPRGGEYFFTPSLKALKETFATK